MSRGADNENLCFTKAVLELRMPEEGRIQTTFNFRGPSKTGGGGGGGDKTVERSPLSQITRVGRARGTRGQVQNLHKQGSMVKEMWKNDHPSGGE